METWAVIPVKSLAQTKSRLTAVLSPSERAELTLFLLQRTIGILQAAGISNIVVVSRDTAVAKAATQQGALTLAEPPNAGLNGAIQEGVRLATLGHANHVLVLPADLPFLTAADVKVVCADSSSRTITICPDRHEQGTNALLLPTQVDFTFQFGEGSFQKHVKEVGYACTERSRSGRFTPRLIRTPGWQFDLDTVEDWAIYNVGQLYQVDLQ